MTLRECDDKDCASHPRPVAVADETAVSADIEKWTNNLFFEMGDIECEKAINARGCYSWRIND
jgi:hypothetical protein